MIDPSPPARGLAAPVRKQHLVIIAIVIAGLATWAIAPWSDASLPRDLRGTMQLNDPKTYDNRCNGTGGYNDIRTGSPVTVADGTGKVVATGLLGLAKRVAPSSCMYEFRVRDLPKADFYSVEVSHRGALTKSRADLEASNWFVALSLGD